jgi:hypothetical protein
MMRTSYAVLLLASFLVPSVVSAERVPKSRLSKGVYTSPGGEYTVKVPELIGAHIEERQTSLTTRGVFFADDFGKTHLILLTDNKDLKMTLDQVAADFTVGELLREKDFITTGRGRELRMAGVNRGGSPLVTHMKENGKKVEKANDLAEAWAIFLHGDYICQVTTGVTPLEGATEAQALARAKERLESFIAGLEFKDGSSPKPD